MKRLIPSFMWVCVLLCEFAHAETLSTLQYRFNAGQVQSSEITDTNVSAALRLAISYADLESGSHTVFFRIVDANDNTSEWVSQQITLTSANIDNTVDGSSLLSKIQTRFTENQVTDSVENIDNGLFIQRLNLDLAEMDATHYVFGMRAVNQQQGTSGWVEQALRISASYVAANGNPPTILAASANIIFNQGNDEPITQTIDIEEPNFSSVVSASIDTSDLAVGAFTITMVTNDSIDRQSSASIQSAMLRGNVVVNRVEQAEYLRNNLPDGAASDEIMVQSIDDSSASFITQTLDTSRMREARNQLTYRGTDSINKVSPLIVQAIQLPDNDNDNVQNLHDAFIDDPSAADDTDEDGSPDRWNPGKSQVDSTQGLHLDVFPTDPAASIDSDGDGYPDAWNPGQSQADSTTPLFLDAFPNDPTEWADFDGDGIGNNADTDDDDDGIPDVFETNNGLDPFDPADAAADRDEDGLSNLEEFQRRTDLDDPDTDGDGLLDGVDNDPLSFDEMANQIRRGIVLTLDDLNDDAIRDFIIVRLIQEQTTGIIISGSDGTQLHTINWDAIFEQVAMQPILVPDMDNDGRDEVGLFGIRNDTGAQGRLRLDTLNPLTGELVKRYNWPDAWYAVSPLILKDINGDGISDIGMQGRSVTSNRPQLIVRDGDSQRALTTFSFPDLFSQPQYMQLSDVNDDGLEEIGLFGIRRNNGKVQIRVADATSPTTRYRSFNFGNGLGDVSWNRLSDSNQDGIDDWGLFATNVDDGRKLMFNKRGNDPRGMLNIFAWPSDMEDVTFERVTDIDGDSVDELAVSGLRNNERYQLIVKNGTSRSTNEVSLGWANNWSDGKIIRLPDVSGDDIEDYALLGLNQAENWELIVRDAITKQELGRISFTDNWLARPEILSVDDIDGDGVEDVLVIGAIEDESQTQIRALNPSTLEIIWE